MMVVVMSDDSAGDDSAGDGVFGTFPTSAHKRGGGNGGGVNIT
jgi:hypothetical protein